MRQTIDKLTDRVILNALARDGEQVKPSDGVWEEERDKVHESVARMCAHLRDATNHLEWTIGALTVLTKGEPTGEREQSVPDCLACSNLALPRPKSGFCQPCYASWLRFSAAKKGDRFQFIEWRKAQTVTTVTTSVDAGQEASVAKP